jgi:putative ABC transport system ATP-binding protein
MTVGRHSPAVSDDTAPVALHDTQEWRVTPPPVIELRDVRKVYKSGILEVEAVRGVSATIEQGDFVAIMGPSGSGKSTLMHIIGCLDVPTSGLYRLAGQDVSRMSEVELAHVRNRSIGFVFQQYNLLPTMTAWRNVELPLTYANVDKAERRVRAMEALERVGIAHCADHRPGEMSGGQQQRVAVARALVTNPDLILCDEPTGALDTVAAGEVLDLLSELNQSGRSVVLITHEPDVAAGARHILRIRDGLFVDDSRVEAAAAP